jgi:hypothetical protein
MYKPIKLKGTLMKAIDKNNEDTQSDFINISNGYIITYDHNARKFYVLLKSGIFAVVENPVDMLPQAKPMENKAPESLRQLVE